MSDPMAHVMLPDLMLPDLPMVRAAANATDIFSSPNAGASPAANATIFSSHNAGASAANAGASPAANATIFSSPNAGMSDPMADLMLPDLPMVHSSAGASSTSPSTVNALQFVISPPPPLLTSAHQSKPPPPLLTSAHQSKRVIPFKLVDSANVSSLETLHKAPFLRQAPFQMWLQQLTDAEFLQPLIGNVKLVLPRNHVDFPEREFPLSKLAPWVTSVRREAVLWIERVLGFVHANAPTSSSLQQHPSDSDTPPLLITDERNRPDSLTLETLGPLFAVQRDGEGKQQAIDSAQLVHESPPSDLSLAWLFFHVLTPKHLLQFDAWMLKQSVQLRAHTKRRVRSPPVLVCLPSHARAMSSEEREGAQLRGGRGGQICALLFIM